MKPLSPMGAQRSLAYSEKYDTHMAIGHRRALETIAGMRTEYRAEYQAAGGCWFPVPHYCSCGRGWGTKEQAERNAAAWKADGYATRIVPRYVTEPEEIS